MTTTPIASLELPDLDKLETLARAATPGPWSWWTSNSTLRLTGADGRDGGVLYGYARHGNGDVNCAPNDQAFISAANPAALLALIALARRARPYATGGRVPGGLHLAGEAPGATCTVPPEGWHCTRAPGHDGPCAARPIAKQAAAPGALDADEMTRLRRLMRAIGWDHERDESDKIVRGTLFAVLGRAADKLESAPGTPEAPKPTFPISDDEMAALRRFSECATDGEGYDVEKSMMQRLAEMGLVQRKSGAYYMSTEFGLYVLGEYTMDRAAAPKGGA